MVLNKTDWVRFPSVQIQIWDFSSMSYCLEKEYKHALGVWLQKAKSTLFDFHVSNCTCCFDSALAPAPRSDRKYRLGRPCPLATNQICFFPIGAFHSPTCPQINKRYLPKWRG